MGFFIMGFLIGGFFIFLSNHYKSNYGAATLLFSLIFMAGAFAGIFLQTGGYTIREGIADHLQPLNNPTSTENGMVFYVNVTDNNEYMYYKRVASDYTTENSKAYASKSVSIDKSTIIEEENCEVPRVIKYYKEAKSTFWSYGAMGTEEFWVFYIPKGALNFGIDLRQ